MTDLILVRHGQTPWNPQGRPRGRAEVPLDQVGIRQAKAVARAIADHCQPAAVYHSPLLRTAQTALEVATLTGAPAIPHVGLLDVDFGAWEGLLPADIAAHWPEAWGIWRTEPQNAVIPDGETLAGAQSRALAAVREICLSHPEATVVAVSHTAINRLVILGALGIDLARFWHLGQDTAAINVLAYDGQSYTLQHMNLTVDLGA